MKPTNRFYGHSPQDPADRSPLHKCVCQRLNTLKGYRDNRGKCPKCGAPYAGDEDA